MRTNVTNMPTSPTRMRQSIALVIVAGVLLGTTGTAAAFAPAEATPMVVGELRLIAGAVVLLAVLPWLGGRWSHIPKHLRRPTIWVMAAGAAAYQPCFFGAVERSGVAMSTLVAVGSGPIFAGLIGWAVLRHRPTLAWVGATLIALLGLLFCAWDELAIGDWLGMLMAIGAGLSSACYVVAAKVELNRGGQVAELPAMAYLLGSLLLAPLLFGQSLGWIFTLSGIALALFLGIITMALANVVQIKGLRGLSPGPAATLLLADPLTATILGVLVLGETIPPVGIIGLVLVLVGLLLQGVALGRRRTDEPVLEPAL